MEWRLFRGWSEAELRQRFDMLRGLSRNFEPSEIGRGGGWRYYASRAEVGREAPGPPVLGGAFARARRAVEAYEFSDPRIVTGHYDPTSELAGRRMLLEIKVFGLRYLNGTAVGEVLSGEVEGRTVFGFRYETLEGHLERGFEWFVLSKDHRTGEVEFRIEAVWSPGDFPNWWSRVGFKVLVLPFQRAWHRLAYLRLRRIVGAEGLRPVPRRRELLHVGPEIPGPGIWSMSREHFVGAEVRPELEFEGRERRIGRWRTR